MAIPAGKLYEVGNDGVFQGRVQALACKVALAVYAENPATTGHAARARLAVAILNDPVRFTYRVTMACVAQWTAASYASPGAVPDADIETALSAAWNALAGV